MIDQCSTVYLTLLLALSTYHRSFFFFTLTVRLLTVYNILLASPCSDSFIEYRPIDKTVKSHATNRQQTRRILLTSLTLDIGIAESIVFVRSHNSGFRRKILSSELWNVYLRASCVDEARAQLIVRPIFRITLSQSRFSAFVPDALLQQQHFAV